MTGLDVRTVDDGGVADQHQPCTWKNPEGHFEPLDAAEHKQVATGLQRYYETWPKCHTLPMGADKGVPYAEMVEQHMGLSGPDQLVVLGAGVEERDKALANKATTGVTRGGEVEMQGQLQRKGDDLPDASAARRVGRRNVRVPRGRTRLARPPHPTAAEAALR